MNEQSWERHEQVRVGKAMVLHSTNVPEHLLSKVYISGTIMNIQMHKTQP